MHLEYTEQPENFFRYCLTYSVSRSDDDFWSVMNVNEWICECFGPLGELWGWDNSRINISDGDVAYLAREPSIINYRWRFKNKADAMYFKLTWHK